VPGLPSLVCPEEVAPLGLFLTKTFYATRSNLLSEPYTSRNIIERIEVWGKKQDPTVATLSLASSSSSHQLAQGSSASLVPELLASNPTPVTGTQQTDNTYNQKALRPCKGVSPGRSPRSLHLPKLAWSQLTSSWIPRVQDIQHPNGVTV
jgi:hypothetical protein